MDDYTPIRGHEIRTGDYLQGHDGSRVEVTELWVHGGELWMTYLCANGDELEVPVLSQGIVHRLD